MDEKSLSAPAWPIITGIEDKFFYSVTSACVKCGICACNCPANAIEIAGDRAQIDSDKCIDCGICSAVCTAGAAQRVPVVRENLPVESIDKGKCLFNAGCALKLYKLDIARMMLELLQEYYGDIKPHDICCRHDPKLPEGTVIINNCAGCDRRFRSLYQGIGTVSYWEVIDSIEGIRFPDYGGRVMSVHDSCGYRHRPQVHEAVRSLLHKMNISVVEAGFHGTESICCGDNLYGCVPNETVRERMRMRASQFPCENVVVYCIGCERAMLESGKNPFYLPDLIFNRSDNPNTDSLDEYHLKLAKYIEEH